MNDIGALELWRLASDISVVNAAILIAGGDPEQARDCHGDISLPGFTGAFEALTNAIKGGHLKAVLVREAERGPLYDGRQASTVWVTSAQYLPRNVDPIAYTGEMPEDEERLYIVTEPSWERSSINVEDLRVWLRSRGCATGFFFPPEVSASNEPDVLMNPDHDRFAPELALAVTVWRALADLRKFPRGTKSAIEAWIESNPDAWAGSGTLSASAKKRIATLVNWRRDGGAPRSGA